MKLKKAAQIIACPGLSTLVETIVAMELGASWKLLIMSNSKANEITIINVSIVQLINVYAVEYYELTLKG